ncbi:TonB-dependent siderophore receptor [Wohlfahrtiimonas sp. G9077]|uniref:TonB-dependent receptor plug domain-containing protein n=1 Tax=Wohlfahrtiimonas sp. G9077 TaxID=1980118 RepID=UPI000B98B5EA|nr:TonB-dependent receptor [Wohlfahrtiimonas sp. G9077]OYQ75695.1 hypothetical protein B9T20_03050 [Wohlfahrtiimonas sp. G9077]
MKTQQLYAALSATLLAPIAFADDAINVSSENDTIVFTANRADQALDTVGSSINVITKAQLERGQYQRVSDALATLPGINVSTTSANGESNVFLRGLGSQNMLVMIDGVIINDLSTPAGGFDFSSLNTLNIDRIEVLKGPQSTLYGSNAMAGVIQVFTQKGGPQRTTITLEGGSYEHVKTTIQTQGMTDTLSYAFAAGLEQEHGISAADAKLPGNSERDHYKNRNLSGYVNYAPTDFLNFDVMLRYDRSKTDLDNGAGANQDNLDYYQKSERYLGRFAINTINFNEQWLSSLIYDASQTKRDYHNMPFTQHAQSSFKSTKQSITWQNTLAFIPNFQTLLGANFTKESMSSTSPYGDFPKRHITQKSIYVDQHLNFADRFFNTVGIRYEDHSKFGDKLTYRFTSRFNVNDYLALKGSYGTGFKAPTLFQLYDTESGNQHLKAEKSKGFDAGIVVTPWQNTSLELTYFQQKINQRITWVSNPVTYKSTYLNRDYTKTKGVEFSANTALNDQWAFGLNYTYTHARDYTTVNGHTSDQKALRVPKHMAGMHVNFKPSERMNLFAEAKYHGSATSNFNNPAWSVQQRNLKAYWMVNLAADYQINDTVSVYGRVNNLLDKQYYSVWGYGQKRINGNIGVKVAF